MFWKTLFISASCYTWYLILLPGQGALYPASLIGFAGLFFIALIPTFLGSAFNNHLLKANPTVIKALLANGAAVLVVAGLTAFYAGFFSGSPNPNLLFPSFWQLVSWSLGAYYLYNIGTSLKPPAPGFPLRSLLMAVSAFFLLNFMERPHGPLIALILFWFIILALSVALEESGSTLGGPIRYDILTFHTLIPVILAFFLLAAAFFRDLRVLLLEARNFILYLLAMLLHFLDKLFSAPPEGRTMEKFIRFMPQEEIYQRAGELPPWVVVLVAAPILFFLVVKLFFSLWDWLRLRLEAAPTRPKGVEFSPLKALRLMVLGIIFFIKKVLFTAEKLFVFLQIKSFYLFRKLKNAWTDWLPPRTPYQKVLRSYIRFLQWGRSTGCRRFPGETPSEYIRRLEEHSRLKNFPGKDIHRLTQIFVEARYDPYPVALMMGEECERLLKSIKRRSLKGEPNPCPTDLNIPG